MLTGVESEFKVKKAKDKLVLFNSQKKEGSPIKTELSEGKVNAKFLHLANIVLVS